MATTTLIWEPLSSTTNNSNSPPPSPPNLLSKTTKSNPTHQSRVDPAPKPPPLRRKTTIQDLVNLDSSESYPSLHSSIYEASIEFNYTCDGKGGHESWIHDRDNASEPPWANTVCNTNGDSVPVSFLEPIASPKLHTPHKLYPITEQASSTTLHPLFQSSALSKRSSNLILQARRSRSPGLNGMRQKSFSLSDLPSLPAPELPSAAEPSPPATIVTVPQPNQPLHPPPARSSTPPNIPRFGTPEACTYRLPRPSSPLDSTTTNKKRKKKKKPSRLPSSTPEVREWRRQTIALPKNVIMRGSDGTLVKGKFIPSQSGHNGPLRPTNTTVAPGHHGGPGNGQGNVPHTPYILPEVRPARYSDLGTRASWTDAVMTGGIGAGPGVDARFTPGVLRAQREQVGMERRRRMGEGWAAWRRFMGGWGGKKGGGGGCCRCERGMWRCCPGVKGVDGDGGEGGNEEAAARIVTVG